LATEHPDLLVEFDYEANDPLSAEDLTPGSATSVWWKCPVDPSHRWQISVGSRTRLGTGCPYCEGLKVGKDNSLATVFPEVAKQWHLTKNDRLTPNDVVAPSSKRVWWKCPHGPDHEWQTTVHKRSIDRTGCPFCDGQQLSVTNRLDTVRPDIASRLDPDLNPPGVAARTFYSESKKKLWFRCQKDVAHVFLTRPHYLTIRGGDCPLCRASRLERTVEDQLKARGIAYQREWRDHDLKHKKKLSFDFFLPVVNAAIECDGEQHFKPMRFDKGPDALQIRQKRDRLKDEYCKDAGIALLRVRFDNLNVASAVDTFLMQVGIREVGASKK
tara:strand:+ start:181 stop:1164 length:984 start_codon:yes stop_codon:yes gene_type:complete